VTRAGFAKVEISTSAVGAELMGYGNRHVGAVAVRDPLYTRALVVECGDQLVALCSVDLCAIDEDLVGASRERIASECGIAAGNVLVSATHTHSGPHDDDPACWPDGLEARIAAAVADACERLTPAMLGVGWGTLPGHGVNRRRLEDPVDPALLVVRIDDTAGRPLGMLFGFGCHPVVLGPDNLEVSGDWPGHAAALLEEHLGPDAIAVFVQGSSGDVNPLTEGVRERVAVGEQITTEVPGTSYYGGGEAEEVAYEIGDRRGGSFAEMRRMGEEVAAEALRAWRGIAPEAVDSVWTRQLMLADGTVSADPPGGHRRPRVAPDQPMEVMLVGVEGLVLVGLPGEAFACTGVALRRALRLAGARHPFVVTHANGRRGYLPPADAFPEGGYEVDWARAMGHPETLQDDIRALVLGALAG
jgi:neutral ceramidase